MAYFLVKSEPYAYSWDMFVEQKIATWDGVRNYAARNNLMSMQKGDQVLFYHSNEGMEIVGIAQVSREYFPDPSAESGSWVAVELVPVKKLNRPVRLKEIKSDLRLQNMGLVRLSRLSVSTLTEEEFTIIIEKSHRAIN